MSERQYWGLDGIIMTRPRSFRRPAGTVICGLGQGAHYAAQGYAIDWKATEEAFRASKDPEKDL